MVRRIALAVAVAGLLVVGGIALAGVHGNHVNVDAQVTGDGRVVVESYFSTPGGFVVVRADDGGEPGRVLGHAEAPQGRWNDVTVPVDGGDLPSEGSTTLWAVLHRDDGDGEFDPDDDPPIEGFGAVAGSQFRVRTGPAPVSVVAATQGDRRSNGSVVLDRVELASPGHVVVHADDRGDLGRVVGYVPLEPGTHQDVRVALNASHFREQSTSFELRAVVYADDGDCAFDPDDDRPVTVGDDPVATHLTVIKHESESATNATDSAGSTAPGDCGAAATTDDGEGGGGGGDDGSGDGDDGNGDGGSANDGGNGDGGDGDGQSLPGFGAGIALVALLAVALVRRLR